MSKIEKLANYIIGGLSGSEMAGQKNVFNLAIKELFKFGIRYESDDALKLFKIWVDREMTRYNSLYRYDAETYGWDDVEYKESPPWEEQISRTDGQRYYGHIFSTLGAIDGYLTSLDRE